MDVKYIQTLTLGGPNMNDIFITSATLAVDLRTGKNMKKQPCYPNAGNFIKVENFASQGFRDKKLCH